MYKILIRPVFFLFEAETAHRLAMNVLWMISKIPLVKRLLKWWYCKSSLTHRIQLFGIDFKNPIGLAAGFDKDGKYVELLDLLGFGFIEVGTVTPKPQKGNPKPRLFRLKKDQAIINRMGFNNKGVDALARNLSKIKNKNIVIGGNIGKNKATPNDEAYKDYLTCFQKLYPYVDYFVVNVSSPNTPGLRSLQAKAPLDKILSSVRKANLKTKHPKPVLLKIAPDLTMEQLNEIIQAARDNQVSGIIAGNTTVSRENLITSDSELDRIGKGGLSGYPLKERSTKIIRQIVNNTGTKIPIVGVGGIFTADDVQEKFEAGASLVQLFTGFIYVGPGIVKQILKKMKK